MKGSVGRRCCDRYVEVCFGTGVLCRSGCLDMYVKVSFEIGGLLYVVCGGGV